MAFSSSYVNDIKTYFKNVALNAVGAERDLEQLLKDKDVFKALNLFEDNTTDVDNALKEYNPQLHDIMSRPNKYPKGKQPYITCKLPQTKERYINEVELFFLLGQGVEFSKVEGDDEAYKAFIDFIREYHWDSRMRQCKRLAGAETESAKLYRIYQENDMDKNGKELDSVHAECDMVVLSRSTGYKLRPMFDQYGNLMAFAYGYKLKNSNGVGVQHWDILTKDKFYYCVKSEIGWRVDEEDNILGKIPVIYYKQKKAWDGVEALIKREEELKSKIGDTNNYFADPIALATADVVESMFEPSTPAKMLIANGRDARFEYINPPMASELRKFEMESLTHDIFFNSMTPDFDVSKMSGFGTLTGPAVRNSFTIAYIKRENLKETYCELLNRDVSLIKEFLKLKHPTLAEKIDALVIEHNFAEPFANDRERLWQSLGQLYSAGLVSLETAVEMLALTHAPQEEIDRIKMAEMEKLMAQQELAAEKQQEGGIGQNTEQVDENGERVLTKAEHIEKAAQAAAQMQELTPGGTPKRYQKKPKGTNEGDNIRV